MSYIINCTPDGTREYPMHTHSSYEIMVYLEGEGNMRTELGDIPFSKGTVIIVAPEIKHGSESTGGFKNISIAGDFKGYLNFKDVFSFCDNESGDGRTLANLIYENRYGNAAYLGALCTALISFVTQGIEIQSPIYKSVRSVITQISAGALDSGISLSKILANSGYSEDYIRAAFKELTDKTPHEFLTDIRISHACFLIEVYKTELPLAEIAERCGYLDYIYFSKQFKKATGLSPSQYRNKKK